MLWIKALHVIFMVTWFAGLFYLPRIFVYHAMTECDDKRQCGTFKTMERKLLIMTHIGGVLAVVFGLVLLIVWLPGLLMQLKLALVALLVVYHLTCMKLVADFKHDRSHRSHVWYRWFNELPVLLLAGIVILVIVKPFN